LVGTCDLKCEIEVLRCDLFAEVEREEAAVDVFTGNLSVNEVWTLASPIHSLTDDKIASVT
jgi:hypothetical protein